METQTFELLGTSLGPVTLTVPAADAAETLGALVELGFVAQG
jgi:hypothetical protein